jgi:hypothetical protein
MLPFRKAGQKSVGFLKVANASIRASLSAAPVHSCCAAMRDVPAQMTWRRPGIRAFFTVFYRAAI